MSEARNRWLVDLHVDVEVVVTVVPLLALVVVVVVVAAHLIALLVPMQVPSLFSFSSAQVAVVPASVESSPISVRFV